MMNPRTTLILVLVALILGAAALLSGTKEAEPEIFSDQGELFFPELADPGEAREIEVFEPDPDTATVKIFNVRSEKGVWCIPSHHGYPADATERMATAATAFIGLKKDSLVSTSAEDRAKCRVEDPLDDTAIAAGRGKRMRLKDGSGRILADMIVGNEVEGKDGWAYLREPDGKRIYASDLRPTKESGSAELLSKISTKFSDWIDTDLLRLTSSDVDRIVLYNYSVDEETGSVKDMEETALVLGEDKKWKIEPLAEDQETNETTVRGITGTLDSLLIAGVRPTPEPLTTLSLLNKGFYRDAEGRLYGNEGHMQVHCKDGVIYFLYFGEILFGSEDEITAGTDAAAEETSAAEGGAPAAAGAENRYLFVRVMVDPALETPPEDGAAGAASGGTEAPAASPEDAAAPAAEAGSETGGEKGEGEKTEAEKRKEEWQKKLDASRKRVDELNLRFAKWYYVITGDNFNKLRKKRSDLVQPKLPDTAAIGEQPPEGRQPIKKPSGLAYTEIDYGSGKAAVDGDLVKVLYTGWLKDGTEFDRAADRAAPFTFTLGKGEVIKGWDEGIVGIRKGGKRKLIIPPELGYGAKGAGEKIPPDAWLIFDVELIEAVAPEPSKEAYKGAPEAGGG